jgi:hypothetical protein
MRSSHKIVPLAAAAAVVAGVAATPAAAAPATALREFKGDRRLRQPRHAHVPAARQRTRDGPDKGQPAHALRADCRLRRARARDGQRRGDRTALRRPLDRARGRALRRRRRARRRRRLAQRDRPQPVARRALPRDRGPRLGGAPLAGSERGAQRRAPYAAYRCALRARALAASASRFLGGAAVTSSSSSRVVAALTASTARLNAASFAFDGFVEPLILRTYCSAASWASSRDAGGSKLWRVRMFRHMPSRYTETR